MSERTSRRIRGTDDDLIGAMVEAAQVAVGSTLIDNESEYRRAMFFALSALPTDTLGHALAGFDIEDASLIALCGRCGLVVGATVLHSTMADLDGFMREHHRFHIRVVRRSTARGHGWCDCGAMRQSSRDTGDDDA